MTLDADGTVVSVSVAEPRFPPREKALLIAARRSANAPRGRHGILLSEATDPNIQWEVDLPTRDRAQAEIDKAMDAYEERWGKAADMRSLLWRVKRA